MSTLPEKQATERIILTEKHRTSFVEVGKITHLVCDGYVSTLYLEHSSPMVIARMLKQFEQTLLAYQFIRINRNTLINPMYVETMEKRGAQYYLKVKDCFLPVSRRKVSIVKAILISAASG